LAGVVFADKIYENNKSPCLNYYKFMATMKYFDSNMVYFAEINNIGENVTYSQCLNDNKYMATMKYFLNETFGILPYMYITSSEISEQNYF
jgi:hypothetical protein